jgi:hypothetical protein
MIHENVYILPTLVEKGLKTLRCTYIWTYLHGIKKTGIEPSSLELKSGFTQGLTACRNRLANGSK